MLRKSLNSVSQNEDLGQLVKELKKGSAEAFHIIYNKYQNRIYRFCLKMLGDSNLAKDAFQETFIRLHEKKHTFRGENFTSWLFTISRHTCLNHLRSKKEYEEYNEVYHTDTKTKSEDVLLKEILEKSINTLPISLREAFILREYEQCTYNEISEILDIELSLAKIRVHRARVLLRKLLKPIVKEINES
ncbi:RNA polymerase sigma factor [Candidatus Kapabacteria bacterium]|nr:RNA polymerase sigma factor [Candidatus Kapabacteria bacterium]